VSESIDTESMLKSIGDEYQVCQTQMTDCLCTPEGLAALGEKISQSQANRLVIGACRPLCEPEQKGNISRSISFAPELVEITDTRSSIVMFANPVQPDKKNRAEPIIKSLLNAAVIRAAHAEPDPPEISVPEPGSTLIAGGGIAGMTAALAIAGHGYEVFLTEISHHLGGSLNWLNNTIEGHDIGHLREQTIKKVQAQPLITVYTGAQIKSSDRISDGFITTIEKQDRKEIRITHGAVILATGAIPLSADICGPKKDQRIIDQQQLEAALGKNEITPGKLSSVCMILCAGTRKEPRNYCSRVCCATALKHALYIKQANADVCVYIFYRDIMSTGFLEAYFTRARKAGVIFIAYDPQCPPEIVPQKDVVRVFGKEPLLGRKLEISADLVVLATGMEPAAGPDLAPIFGAECDEFGFFKEAEYKWQPVFSGTPGVFACGTGLRPGSIPESIASAEAAAQQVLCMFAARQKDVPRPVARVRHSLCSLCGACIQACPLGARSFDPDSQKVEVNAFACSGCGACAAACPNFASWVENFSPAELMAEISAIAEPGDM
jgi:heterodisulfide reductase subunit A